MLIDQARIYVKAGDGGPGAVSFRREKYVPKGGPDGGNGGKGADVYFKVDSSINTLLDFRYRQHFKAQSGRPGRGSNRTGKSAQNLFIPVPAGTIIKISQSSRVLAELTREGATYLVAKGGRGGRGNASFATSTNRAPRKFEPGAPGEELELDLELKLLADVGLVGLPNAGKSTLLAKISHARPKIADYPFTTLEPHLGIVSVEKYKSFVMADLPGLIEGASQGKGLGHRFLKHVERARVLVMLIDSSSKNPQQDAEMLENELGDYKPELLKKPRLTVLSKSDLLDSDLKIDIPADLRISSVTGEGIDRLVLAIWSLLQRENDVD